MMSISPYLVLCWLTASPGARVNRRLLADHPLFNIVSLHIHSPIVSQGTEPRVISPRGCGIVKLRLRESTRLATPPLSQLWFVTLL